MYNDAVSSEMFYLNFGRILQLPGALICGVLLHIPPLCLASPTHLHLAQ